MSFLHSCACVREKEEGAKWMSHCNPLHKWEKHKQHQLLCQANVPCLSTFTPWPFNSDCEHAAVTLQLLLLLLRCPVGCKHISPSSKMSYCHTSLKSKHVLYLIKMMWGRCPCHVPAAERMCFHICTISCPDFCRQSSHRFTAPCIFLSNQLWKVCSGEEKK